MAMSAAAAAVAAAAAAAATAAAAVAAASGGRAEAGGPGWAAGAGVKISPNDDDYAQAGSLQFTWPLPGTAPPYGRRKLSAFSAGALESAAARS